MLKEILNALPTPPAVKQVTLDFEAAMWAALRYVLPTVQLQGCVFHWTQTVWRKVGQPTRTNNDIEGTFILKIEWQIKQDVIRIKYAKTSYVFLSHLLCFVLILTFPGWHHALNRRAKGRHLPFYELIELLHREAKLVAIQIRLVSTRS